MKPSDLVISIPHAGTDIPEDIHSLMVADDFDLKKEPDLYTDQIYNLEGHTVIKATNNRVISDPNRAPDEVYLSGRQRSEGVVMLSLSHRGNVYKEDPPLELMEKWINRFHVPYHQKLDEAMSKAKFLIDGHSLWSISPPFRGDAGTQRPDIVLGNRFYATCDALTTQFFQLYFEKLGYSVAINNPYAGRYILSIHCSRLRVPGVQIEINRKLYLDEATLEPNANNIARLHQEFQGLVTEFCKWEAKQSKTLHICDLCMHTNSKLD